MAAVELTMFGALAATYTAIAIMQYRRGEPLGAFLAGFAAGVAAICFMLKIVVLTRGGIV